MRRRNQHFLCWPFGQGGAAGGALGALALNGLPATIVNGQPSSGTITGATAGSSISATGLPPGFTINSPARTWAYDGTVF